MTCKAFSVAALCLAAAVLRGQTQNASTVVVTVPATSSPYLAGMPPGSKSTYGDKAPDESPVLVEVSLEGATAVSFSAAGGVDHVPGCPPGCDGPDGSIVTEHENGSENGISGITAPMNALVGVFLGDDRPNRGRAPKELSFDDKKREFTSLSPQLKQVFFIGAGKNQLGATRRFLVPKGATRLFLATMDSYGWYNNTGSYSVTVTVERPNITAVNSSVSFADWPCLPNRSRCTPAKEMVEARGRGQFHVLLPAQAEWGVSIPNPTGAAVTVRSATGVVCLDFATRGMDGCSGPKGNGPPAGEGFLAPDQPAGALVSKTTGARTFFSVNDRSGAAFQTHDGFFEFDVSLP